MVKSYGGFQYLSCFGLVIFVFAFKAEPYHVPLVGLDLTERSLPLPLSAGLKEVHHHTRFSRNIFTNKIP